jgi:hypothetical protein
MKTNLYLTFFLLLLQSCCSKQDPNTPIQPQLVLIKNYGGLNLTKMNSQGAMENLLITNLNGLNLVKGYGASFRIIVDKGDTLCAIQPMNSSQNENFKYSEKLLLVNKILNRTDTLLVRYSMQKVDQCNDRINLDEASLNNKKGITRKISDYPDAIEVKF